MYTTSALNTMIAAVEAQATTLKIHSGDPGAAGTANEISTPKAVTYTSSGAGAIDLTATVDFDVVTGDVVSHFSVWNGATLLVYKPFTTNPETYANDGICRVNSAALNVANIA